METINNPKSSTERIGLSIGVPTYDTESALKRHADGAYSTDPEH